MNEPAAPSPIRVDSLHIDSLERGRVHRLWLDLVQDALGRPIRLPVLVMRGAREGPVLGLTAALHGNELNGIPVIHELFRKQSPKKLRGTLVAVAVVNVPGFLRNEREFIDGTDLNHIMPGEAAGNVSRVYAHRLLDRVVRRFDYLLDLHTASFGRINSLYVRACMSTERTARMAYLQGPQIIVHNPPSDRTLRGAAQELGIPAITVEIGNPHRFQKSYITSTLRGIRQVMAELGMAGARRLVDAPDPVLCARSYWLYTQHGGLLQVLPDLTEFVEKDEIIARITDPFGTVTATYRAPERGIVVGRSVNPTAQTGARILHLGIPVEPDNADFIARGALAPRED